MGSFSVVLIVVFAYVLIYLIHPSATDAKFAGTSRRQNLTIGSPCQTRRHPGTCKLLQDCPSAIANLRAGIQPTVCQIKRGSAIACCRNERRISGRACEQYLKLSRNVLETKREQTHNNNSSALDAHAKCHVDIALTDFIAGGRDSGLHEFPHQVALGYEQKKEITWGCGGTLISSQFVMTAAHCVKDKGKGSLGLPTKVLIGDIQLSKKRSSKRRIIKIKKIIPHPENYEPIVYNDIALILLEEKVHFSDSVFPACLVQPEERLDKHKSFTATGWGQKSPTDPQSDILQVVDLNKFTHSDCNRYFNDTLNKQKTMPEGIISSQICAGNKIASRDTCNGDSGGPLSILKDDSCVHHVVGVTSFGSSLCGFQLPGVYTNVLSFLTWIEDNVWPANSTEFAALNKQFKDTNTTILNNGTTASKSTTTKKPIFHSTRKNDTSRRPSKHQNDNHSTTSTTKSQTSLKTEAPFSKKPAHTTTILASTTHKMKNESTAGKKTTLELTTKPTSTAHFNTTLAMKFPSSISISTTMTAENLNSSPKSSTIAANHTTPATPSQIPSPIEHSEQFDKDKETKKNATTAGTSPSEILKLTTTDISNLIQSYTRNISLNINGLFSNWNNQF